MEPSFNPVLWWLALLASDEASLCFHSWIVDTVAVLLVAVVKVTAELKDVDVTVAYHQRCLLYNRLSLQTVVNLVTGLIEVLRSKCLMGTSARFDC